MCLVHAGLNPCVFWATREQFASGGGEGLVGARLPAEASKRSHGHRLQFGGGPGPVLQKAKARQGKADKAGKAGKQQGASKLRGQAPKARRRGRPRERRGGRGPVACGGIVLPPLPAPAYHRQKLGPLHGIEAANAGMQGNWPSPMMQVRQRRFDYG